ncbi:hypothetical protein J26TS2_40380 [Shouchella clausii]|uniref:hypothetical protein n=1 Tax=Shouchella tritolerans TaxID=2979466 RepID=UPI000788B281|nr:hypothetical protein [Shouchella tritolerans]GIN14171.1 hypothetical protein J26TS2_40380 [Shouchella clausii]
MSANKRKERPSFLMMVYMWLFILVAVVNITGIASTKLYESIFPFFIVSLLNIFLAALLILQALKTTSKSERRLSIIYLIGLAVLAAVTFFRFLFMQSS